MCFGTIKAFKFQCFAVSEGCFVFVFRWVKVDVVNVCDVALAFFNCHCTTKNKWVVVGAFYCDPDCVGADAGVGFRG